MKEVEALLARSVDARIFPGAAVSIWKASTGWQRACAGLHGYPRAGLEWDAVSASSVYDLASLTKPLAASLIAGRLAEAGRLDIDAPIERYVSALEDVPQGELTCRHLLSHCAGYPSWRPYYEDREKLSRGELLLKAAREPLGAAPGTRAEYSDVGYMALTLVLESAGSARLDVLFTEHIGEKLSLPTTFFLPIGAEAPAPLSRIVPTSECPWRGRLLHAEIEDDNTWALGGVSGQAGLFSTLEDLEVFAEHLWCIRGGEDGVVRSETLARLWEKQPAPEGTTWALGWDTPAPLGGGSLVGENFSRNAIGMWGFTGTGLWMDFERGLIVLSLSNRVHPSRQASDIAPFRRALHDAACAL